MFNATLLGAFGAHILKFKLSTEMQSVYQTGISYQFYHTLALVLVEIISTTHNSKYLKLSGYMFMTGIILFSGSLMLLAITDVKLFGIITPIGGVCFLLGWGLLIKEFSNAASN